MCIILGTFVAHVDSNTTVTPKPPHKAQNERKRHACKYTVVLMRVVDLTSTIRLTDSIVQFSMDKHFVLRIRGFEYFIIIFIISFSSLKLQL